MSVWIRPPSERTCEGCGRIERWSEESETWRVVGETGRTYCIHEWDINGAFPPIQRE